MRRDALSGCSTTAVAVTMMLVERDLATWLGRYPARRRADQGTATPPADTTVLTSSEVIGEGSILRPEFDRLLADGVPAKAAAHYLVEWYAGSVAELVGFGLVGAQAAFVVRPADVRWVRHRDGWVVSVDGPIDAVVGHGHPWAGLDGVTAVEPERVGGAAIDGLVTAVTPIVEVCAGLTRTGRAGLWNEVADAFGMVLAFQTLIEPRAELLEVLRRAMAVPGVPWRARPGLRLVGSGDLGSVHVAQKGGCCLAYTDPANVPADLDGLPIDTAYYCSTCSLRTSDDCDRRQLEWHRNRRRSSPEPEGPTS